MPRNECPIRVHFAFYNGLVKAIYLDIKLDTRSVSFKTQNVSNIIRAVRLSNGPQRRISHAGRSKNA